MNTVEYPTEAGAPRVAIVAALMAIMAWSGGALADTASFKTEVLPILNKYCAECHVPGGDGYEKTGLDTSSYEGVMKGTKHGPIVIPGDSFSSNLSVVVEGRAVPELKMPHSRKGLSRWERLMIRRWINRGAKNN